MTEEVVKEVIVKEVIVEVVALPCQHIYRLENKQETKPRTQGWMITVVCHCGVQWKITAHKGALEAEKI